MRTKYHSVKKPLTIYVYLILTPHLHKVELYHEEISEVKKMVEELRKRSKSLQSSPKHLLVFVNPYGGHGRALKIWKQEIVPVFQLAGLTSEVTFTSFRRYPKIKYHMNYTSLVLLTV